MSDPILGEIKMVGFNFAPRGYAFCEGQLLPISQNTALFSLLGTTYGGDGRTTFALPDLRGRFPMHAGDGTGLSNRSMGESGGTEIEISRGRSPIFGWGTHNEIGEATTDGTSVSAGPYMPPYLAVRFVIALVGIYPNRT